MPYICTALASPVLLSEHTAGAQLSVTANIIICFSSDRAFQKAVIPLPPHPPEPPAPQAHPGVGPHITRLDGSHQLRSKMKLEKPFFPQQMASKSVQYMFECLILECGCSFLLVWLEEIERVLNTSCLAGKCVP